ncbi:MAG: S24/S26 family peptidase [Williamsia sp.]|nr:S24/S26 family peptidase [Williamsia sp.]
MSWATHYIDKLKSGETVQFRPRGNSMTGEINSGQLVTVEPINDRGLKKGDIVLCKVNGSQYLHLIKAIQGERFQIGNNQGKINGWITRNSIYGICIDIGN